MISKELVDKIIDRYNIKAVNQTAEEYRCCCPLHNETNPSFSINRNTGKWICFAGCGHGGLVKLIMKLGHCDYNTAVEEVHGKQDRYDFQVKHITEPVVDKLVKIALPQEMQRIRTIGDCPKYLLNRLTLETVKQFNLGVCASGYYSDRIIVPITHENKSVGFIARDYSGNAKKKYLFPSGLKTKDFLFNLDKVEGSEIILVEGPFDAMSMVEKGFENTACIFGTSVSTRQATLLQEKGIKKVVLCLDNDAAKDINHGLVAAAELSKKFKYFFNQTYMMQLPPSRDPDECTRHELLKAYMYKQIVATKAIMSPR